MSKFASGKFALENPGKYIGNELPTYRSSWEFYFMKFCDTHPNVVQWANESIKIKYKSPITGKLTTYIPDFLIKYIDKNNKQHVELIEVKPTKQVILEKAKSRYDKVHWAINQAKWTAAMVWCKQHGVTFRIITENELFYR